jgi:hypothetical protein
MYPAALPSFYTRFNQPTSQDQAREENIQYQPYRTTPLILPGAKVNKNNLPTESYLRYHPNPDVRGPPSNTYIDTLMKQKVADSIIQRVVGEEGKVANKQFNSPIGLYSNENIENTLRSTIPADMVSPGRHVPREVQIPVQVQHSPANQKSKIQGYKKTVVFDPTTSATFKALNEQEEAHEVSMAEPKVFRPNRLIPAKKPSSYQPAPEPEYYRKVNVMGEANDVIHQSNSFKRLMYHVLSETDY